MKTRGKRIALLLSLCLLLASLVTVLFVSAEEDAGDVTVAYANGTTETYAVGETIVPIEGAVSARRDFGACVKITSAFL